MVARGTPVARRVAVAVARALPIVRMRVIRTVLNDGPFLLGGTLDAEAEEEGEGDRVCSEVAAHLSLPFTPGSDRSSHFDHNFIFYL